MTFSFNNIGCAMQITVWNNIQLGSFLFFFAISSSKSILLCCTFSVYLYDILKRKLGIKYNECDDEKILDNLILQP